jgi:hypothetical protein
MIGRFRVCRPSSRSEFSRLIGSPFFARHARPSPDILPLAHSLQSFQLQKTHFAALSQLSFLPPFFPPPSMLIFFRR